jgi:hypothetical protein
MSFQRKNIRGSNLEKEYFNLIYKPSRHMSMKNRASKKSTPSQNTALETESTHFNNNFLTIQNDYPNSIHSTSISSSNSLFNERFISNFFYSRGFFNMNDHLSARNFENSSSIRFIDDSETMTIASNLRRLGIESASINSFMNLRNNSYLKSRENDCIETMLIQMGSPDAVAAEPVVALETDNEEKKDAQTSNMNAPLLPPPKIEITNEPNEIEEVAFEPKCSCGKVLDWLKTLPSIFMSHLKLIDSQSNFYLIWLALMSLVYIYNIISISIRFSFNYDNENYENSTAFALNSLENVTNDTNPGFWKNLRVSKRFYWSLTDYFCDIVYVADMFLVQTRIKYLEEGLWQSDIKSTSISYFKSWKFIVKVAFYLIIIKEKILNLPFFLV